MPFINRAFDLLEKITDKYGTKFLVGLGAIGATAYLTYLDKVPGTVGAICIAAELGIYFIARHLQEERTKK